MLKICTNLCFVMEMEKSLVSGADDAQISLEALCMSDENGH